MDISKTAEQFKKARNRLHRINYISIIQLYKINKEHILKIKQLCGSKIESENKKRNFTIAE